MKKLFLVVVTSFALMSSVEAVTSTLNDSVRFIDAITTSPLFQTNISQDEFVVAIKRVTREINATTVLYEVKTSTLPTVVEDTSSGSHSLHHHNGIKAESHKYIATILVSPNPAIGPTILTVESITAR